MIISLINNTTLDFFNNKYSINSQIEKIKDELSKDKVLLNIFLKYKKTHWPNNSLGAFKCLVQTIISQQISTSTAVNIWNKFKLLHEITPKVILNLSNQQYKEIGIPSYKINYLINIAEFSLENNIELLSKDNYENYYKQLIKIKGIGKWTLEMLSIFHLHALDIFPIGDLAIRHKIIQLYNDNNNLTFNQIRNISDKWRPYRTVATIYLWRCCDSNFINY